MLQLAGAKNPQKLLIVTRLVVTGSFYQKIYLRCDVFWQTHSRDPHRTPTGVHWNVVSSVGLK